MQTEAQKRKIEHEKRREIWPILKQIAKLTSEPRRQLRKISKPFDERIRQAEEAAAAIDRVARVEKMIEAMTPDAEALRAAIGEAFTRTPTMHWRTALHQMADEAEMANDEEEGEAADKITGRDPAF